MTFHDVIMVTAQVDFHNATDADVGFFRASTATNYFGDDDVSGDMLLTESNLERVIVTSCVSVAVFIIELGNMLTLISFATHRRLRRPKYIPVASLESLFDATFSTFQLGPTVGRPNT